MKVVARSRTCKKITCGEITYGKMVGARSYSVEEGGGGRRGPLDNLFGAVAKARPYQRGQKRTQVDQLSDLSKIVEH